VDIKGTVSNFHRCQQNKWNWWQNLPPVSLILVAKKFAASVVDTGEKFAIGVVDTSGAP
jgi:hypothetical protein